MLYAHLLNFYLKKLFIFLKFYVIIYTSRKCSGELYDMKLLVNHDFHTSPIYISVQTNYKDIYKMPEMHIHNGYELFFVTSGRNEFFFDDCIFCLSKGKVLIIPPNFPHRSIYKNSTTETHRIELQIIPEKISGITADIVKKYKTPTLLDIPLNKCDHIYKLLKKIKNENSINDEYSETMQLHHTDELMINISRFCTVPKKDTKQNTAHLIMNYINNNFRTKISVSDISKHLHINERTLFIEFRKHSNLTISEYINYVRISHAEHLLTNTDLSVTDIAFACGFNDSNYFSSVFRKLKGVSPTQYIKQNKQP